MGGKIDSEFYRVLNDVRTCPNTAKVVFFLFFFLFFFYHSKSFIEPQISIKNSSFVIEYRVMGQEATRQH